MAVRNAFTTGYSASWETFLETTMTTNSDSNKGNGSNSPQRLLVRAIQIPVPERHCAPIICIPESPVQCLFICLFDLGVQRF